MERTRLNRFTALQLATLNIIIAGAASLTFALPGCAQQSRFSPGSDITSELDRAVESGDGGIAPNRAVIELPAGNFKLSGTVNLHGSTLKGAGIRETFLQFASDLGAGQVGITGDVKSPGGNFEIDDLSIAGPRPARGVAPGTVPNQMDGVHLYDNGILRRVAVSYFNAGVLIDGNHHTLDGVEAKQDDKGVEYVVSSDNTYFDDYFVDCSLTSNGRAGIYIDDNSKMGGATFLRVHTGFEPYSIYLGHNSDINGCQFLQTQFEGSGNADIADIDGTSIVTANDFMNCSGWGSQYDNTIRSEPTTPMLRCGTFSSNTIFAGPYMGPTPGSMSAAKACYGNIWICDTSMADALVRDKITPIVAPANASYGNTLLAGGVLYTSRSASGSISRGDQVDSDNGRYPGAVKHQNGTSIGESLTDVSPGSLAWIAKTGQIEDAFKGRLTFPDIPVGR